MCGRSSNHLYPSNIHQHIICNRNCVVNGERVRSVPLGDLPIWPARFRLALVCASTQPVPLLNHQAADVVISIAYCLSRQPLSTCEILARLKKLTHSSLHRVQPLCMFGSAMVTIRLRTTYEVARDRWRLLGVDDAASRRCCRDQWPATLAQTLKPGTVV